MCWVPPIQPDVTQSLERMRNSSTDTGDAPRRDLEQANSFKGKILPRTKIAQNYHQIIQWELLSSSVALTNLPGQLHCKHFITPELFPFKLKQLFPTYCTLWPFPTASAPTKQIASGCLLTMEETTETISSTQVVGEWLLLKIINQFENIYFPHYSLLFLCICKIYFHCHSMPLTTFPPLSSHVPFKVLKKTFRRHGAARQAAQEEPYKEGGSFIHI